MSIRRILLLFLLLFAASSMGLGTLQPAQAEDLKLFQRYYGTMDYVVAGTGGIRGTGQLDPLTGESLAKKSISIGVPPTADIVAAFLYWQTFEKTGLPSSARGYLSYPSAPNTRVKILGKPLGTGTTAPCWSNGGSTGNSNGAPTVRTYRADILRYLKAPGATSVSPSITAWLRDSGSMGNSVPLTEGVSLVLVYRHPALPFNSVVIYDGSQTMNNSTDFMDLTVKGFYQSAPGIAKITHIVGNGQSNFPERLYFNGQQLIGPQYEFKDGWDVLTASFDTTVKKPIVPTDSASVTTRVDHGSGAFDCLSWGAVVFSTPVKDTDGDGLIDTWETDGYKDLNGNLLVDLPHMGASPTKKDLFVEIDYMDELANDAYGSPHSHAPKAQALEMVGDAFKRAGINVWFDVGDKYLGRYAVASGRKGGDRLNERWPSFYCTKYIAGPPAHCLFPRQPGLISWKKGIEHIKNNYFSEDRDPIFHYVVFAHGMAIKGNETLVGPGGDFQGYVARSVSGRADLPGNTVAIALGRWRSAAPDQFVGSPNLQASTLLHELAHNLWGFHGGITHVGPFSLTDAIVTRDNCNINHQSSLNYVYQSAGLLDALGNYQVDLSGQVVPGSSGQTELALNESTGVGPGGTSTAYRMRWYAPIANAQARFQQGLPLTPAKALCGSSQLVANSGVIRVDGWGSGGNPLASRSVDWDYDGVVDAPLPAMVLDINFNGKANTPADFVGFDDWRLISDIHGLQQVGTGRNLYLLSLGVGASDLLRSGEDDLGEDDLGEDDLGEDDLGEDDLGEDDLGEDDLGEDDLGEDDLGEDDLGEVGDIDEPTAIGLGGSGPTGLAATLLRGPLRVILNWASPSFQGAVQTYVIYRSEGTGLLTEIGRTTAMTLQDNNVQNNRSYTYVVIAAFADGTSSAQSNPVFVNP